MSVDLNLALQYETFRVGALLEYQDLAFCSIFRNIVARYLIILYWQITSFNVDDNTFAYNRMGTKLFLARLIL